MIPEGGICLGEDPEIFFAFESQVLLVAEAKRICGNCPVESACLQAALDRREQYGIFGGKTKSERDLMLV